MAVLWRRILAVEFLYFRFMAKYFLFFSTFLSLHLAAQTVHPANNNLYNPSEVNRIDISINSDSLAYILDSQNSSSNYEFNADFSFTSHGITQTLTGIGFRLRGNTSRNAQKKSFKVALNRNVSGRRFEGVKKINLNGEHNDPSISRARICMELGRQIELPVSRYAHNALYINNSYYGTYLNLEHLNDDWLNLRYGNANGNLYKCTYPADLNFISNNPDSYKLTKSNGDRVYELKTNETQDDYSKLSAFVAVLNNTPLNQLECELDKVFNIEGYLKTLAFEVAIGHWDNYSFNKNNFYLYENSTTGKMEYIPYDMDNTFGIDWAGINWADRDVDNWHNSQDRPLANRLLALPELREIYHFYLRSIHQKMGSPYFANTITTVFNSIQNHALTDSFKTLDYGFTNADFNNSFYTHPPLMHVKKGIQSFISDRVAATQSQLGTFNAAPILSYPALQYTSTSNEIRFSVQVEDEGQPNVRADFSLSGGSIQTLNLYDDGLHGDGASSDGWYGNTMNLGTHTSLNYTITASDLSGQSRTRPCSPAFWSNQNFQDLVINEFMADNDTVIQDDLGDYSDWIEIYNKGNDTIQLAEYFLTDDLSNPTKWQLPVGYIEPNGFRLFWASNNPAGGSNHTNFGLSKNGEEVGLFIQGFAGVDTADYIVFGAQAENESFGRQTDGASNWVVFSNSTPGSSNNPISIEEVFKEGFKVFPNPFNTHFFIENTSEESATISMYDFKGVLFYQKEVRAGQRIEVEDAGPKGLRILQIQGEKGIRTFKLIKN